MNIQQLTKNISLKTKKHSPAILTGLGITGMLSATILAVRATPKALNIIKREKIERDTDEMTKIEVIKAVWKCYIPATITSSLSIACLIGASSVNIRRNAALATAYTLSETALREYKDKVKETIGEKKEQSVREAISKDRLVKNPVSTKEVIITEKGNTLCFDPLSGRYFKSDMDAIEKVINQLNKIMRDDVFVSVNDFYYELGLEAIALGHDLGWDIDKGFVDIHFGSQLADDGTPCLVLEYSVFPQYGPR